MAEIKFVCPSCGIYVASDRACAGMQVACPSCSHPIVVPGRGYDPSATQPTPSCPGSNPGPFSSAPTQNAPKSKTAVVGIAVGLVALLAIGAVAFVFWGTKNSKSSQTAIVPVKTSIPVARHAVSAAPKPIVKNPTSSEPKTEVVLSETFETGGRTWMAMPGSRMLNIAAGQNHTPKGSKAAKVENCADRMYTDTGAEVQGNAKIAFWMNCDEQTAAIGEVRGYKGGGFSTGKLAQAIKIGIYGGPFERGNGNLVGETADPTKYQGHVEFGTNSGWFNLNLPGAPSRSPGWHKFEVERAKDGTTLSFYVDGVLGRTVTYASRSKWTTVLIGSLGTGDKAACAYFDDIKLVYMGARPLGDAANSKGGKSFASKPKQKKKQI